jgi:hypothetical protein
MPGVEVGPQKRKLFTCGLGRDFATHKVDVALLDTAQPARWCKLARNDANGYAGRTAVAGGPIGYHLTAAEAGMGKRLVERLRK